MNSKYKVIKFKKNKFEKIDDLISIEEPLEISIKYKDQNEWVTSSLSITMRTPGHDEDLVKGFLFNEQIIQNLNEVDNIQSIGEKVGRYKIQNKILITLNNSKNINISKIKRDFLTNSSCGVCGKSSLDALEIIKKEKTFKAEPKLTKEIIIKSPSILRQNQSEFSKTGGIHASGLFSSDGKLISLREDVGRHNIFGLWSLELMDQLESDLLKGERKVEFWANSIGVSTINVECQNFDPFFNINTKEDLEKAKEILNND